MTSAAATTKAGTALWCAMPTTAIANATAPLRHRRRYRFKMAKQFALT
jgi:hypothetical protein